jgi:hypothetical protein
MAFQCESGIGMVARAYGFFSIGMAVQIGGQERVKHLSAIVCSNLDFWNLAHTALPDGFFSEFHGIAFFMPACQLSCS